MLALLFAFSNTGIAQTTDEPSLARNVTTNFFEAYQRKDAEALIALWSTKAPDLAAFATDVRQKAAIASGFEMKGFEIQRITVSDATAIARVKVAVQATELKAGQPAVTQLNRTLRLVKEDGRWKVSQYEPTERELANTQSWRCFRRVKQLGAGEGVIGMSWALFVAGVPTTVASQWKVDSASTTSLMIDFHRRLTKKHAHAKSKETKADALRQASLGLWRSERYRHPFYWAGFVMIGDGW